MGDGGGESTPRPSGRSRSIRSPPARRSTPVDPSSLPGLSVLSDLVDLRPLKRTAEEFGPAHPLRVLLLGEPDLIPAAEYAVKVGGWYRLMRAQRS